MYRRRSVKLGKLVFSKALYDSMLPEMVEECQQFVSRASSEVKCEETRQEYIYTLEHPDFIDGDKVLTYILHFERRFDFGCNSLRPKLTKLSYIDEEDYKVRHVKDYA